MSLMESTVEERDSEVRFRVPIELWYKMANWCDDQGIYYRDDSTMLYPILSVKKADAAAVMARWEGAHVVPRRVVRDRLNTTEFDLIDPNAHG